MFWCKQAYKLPKNVLKENKSPPPGGGTPYKRLMGMCRWVDSHFYDWFINYNGVAFSIELLEYGVAHFRICWVRKISKRTRMFVLYGVLAKMVTLRPCDIKDVQ